MLFKNYASTCKTILVALRRKVDTCSSVTAANQPVELTALPGQTAAWRSHSNALLPTTSATAVALRPSVLAALRLREECSSI